MLELYQTEWCPTSLAGQAESRLGERPTSASFAATLWAAQR
jgi:hypothetical protein